MNYIYIILYFVVIFFNLRYYTTGKSNIILTIISSVIATLFLCGSNIAFSDNYVGELDISSYRNEYESLNFLESIDFPLYYLFFYSNHIGQTIGLTFAQWWLLMSASSIGVIYLSCRIHKYNYNLVIACFMAYYEIVFYSGLKFYYGFCFLLLAYGFLLKDNIKNKLLYAFFVCVAGGFHVMYYAFLILLFRINSNSSKFVKLLIFGVIISTIIMRVGGSVMSFMKPIFDALNNDHINTYVDEAVGNGFYIALILEVIMIYIPYRIKKEKERIGRSTIITKNYYYTVLLTLIFCPFYAVSLIFVRLITSFSLVVISACSIEMMGTPRSRQISLRLALMMVFAYIFKQLILDVTIGNYSFYENSIKPFFNI